VFVTCVRSCLLSWVAVWVVDSDGPKEAEVQSYSPCGASVEGTLVAPAKYDWTVCLRRRRGLMSNCFDHLLLLLLLGHIACAVYVDTACCYRTSSVVCRCVCQSVGFSVCHASEPCKNGLTYWDAVWVDYSGGPRELCIRWVTDPPITHMELVRIFDPVTWPDLIQSLSVVKQIVDNCLLAVSVTCQKTQTV